MKGFLQKYRKYILIGGTSLLLVVIVVISLKIGYIDKKVKQASSDMNKVTVLEQVLEKQKLTAITDNNSINYFIYKGRAMGYQYDLLKRYADHLGVELEVKVDNSLSEKFECVNTGMCDLIGIDLTVTRERAEIVDFTVPHSLSRQVLVQHKPQGFRRMSRQQLEDSLIRSQLDLKGKTVYVQKSSSFVSRLKNLSDEIGGDIHIVESDYEAEQLVREVARGEIDYTVCDEHVAKVNRTYYDNIDIQTPVSFPQQLAWAVKKGADSLRISINQWLTEFKKTAEYNMLYHKYFVSRKSAHKHNQQYHSISGGKISPYDDLIKKYSRQIDWDWRLVASVILQESNFRPNVDSWAGAKGLMQLMPETASRFGAKDVYDPEQNIRAGINFLRYLEQQFEKKIDNKEDRIRFVLASYNVGLGHVLDARRLAEKYQADEDEWNEVDTFLVYKSDPEYYNDPVVKYGYARGEEPYKFVREVMDRYEHYKNLVPEA
ncbi:MAG: transporter substrate-binding domain-containing protein [Bacteroidales bacterium]